jgi:dipeptidyl aminopeptidase/acylaminoacyl peptidase
VIVARAAPLDLLQMKPSIGGDAVALFLGSRVTETTPKTAVEYRTAWLASPINYVSASSAPFLLIHGDVDRTVPFHQSELMEAALKKAGVPVKLVRVPGGDHGPTFPGATNPPDYKGEMVKWFDLYLRKTQ